MILDLQLLRHGMTYANEQGLYYGASDIPVCEAGIKDVENKINAGLYAKTQAYYTSGKLRAAQTLKLIFEDVDYTPIPELSEWDFGEFELKAHEELLGNLYYEAFMQDVTGDFVCPGGESKNMFNERIKKGFYILFDDMAAKGYENATLVAHGGTLGYFLINFYDAELNFYDTLPSYAEGYRIKLDYNGESKVEILNIEDIRLKALK